MWIHLTKVPLHMFSWEGLSLLANPVGFPVKLHPEALACSSFDVAKIFVKVDVTKVLPKEMNFTSGGEEFTVEFAYPWLLSRCKHCDNWGHSDKECALKKKGKEKEAASDPKEVVESKERKESKEESSVVSEEVSGEASKLKSGDAKTDGREEEVSDEVSETWAQVPQGKFGCSQPSTPKQIGNEIQISASKYIVLSTNE